MKIIDAQVHIWGKTVTPPSGLHRKVERFSAEDCLKEMDEAGVDAALIHPPAGWDPDAKFLVPDEVKTHMGEAVKRGSASHAMSRWHRPSPPGPTGCRSMPKN